MSPQPEFMNRRSASFGWVSWVAVFGACSVACAAAGSVAGPEGSAGTCSVLWVIVDQSSSQRWVCSSSPRSVPVSGSASAGSEPMRVIAFRPSTKTTLGANTFASASSNCP